MKRQVVTWVRVLRRIRFRIATTGSSLRTGRSFIVGPGARVARGVRIDVGDRVNIGGEITIQTDLSIGDDVMISSHVAFIGNDHDFSDPALTIQQQGRLPRSRVRLEGDNLVGFGVVILGNVTIGYGAIIGAGSLVTKDIAPNSINVGRPAKAIRERRPSS